MRPEFIAPSLSNNAESEIDMRVYAPKPSNPELAIFNFQVAGENPRPSDIFPDPKHPPISVSRKTFQIAFTTKDSHPGNGSVITNPENYNPFLEA